MWNKRLTRNKDNNNCYGIIKKKSKFELCEDLNKIDNKSISHKFTKENNIRILFKIGVLFKSNYEEKDILKESYR